MSAQTLERPTILIVEDEAGPRDALKIILRPFYNLYTVETAAAAVRTIREQPVDLVTLDLKLPDRQGTDLLRQIKLERDDVEVIIITGYGSLRSAMEGLRYGAAGYLLKPFNVTELIRLIDDTIERKRRLDRLRHFLGTSSGLLASEQDPGSVWRLLRELHGGPGPSGARPEGATGGSEWELLLSDLILARSRELFTHCSRVSTYAALLGDALQVAATERKVLTVGAFLHDIGLLGVPDPLLSPTHFVEEPSSDDIKRHPELGARMVLPLGLPAGTNQIIAYHHERYDGTGYPHGLQGEGIPLPARIVGLVEEFDHLTTGPAARPVEEALKEVRRRAGTHFDPALADLFARVGAESKALLPAMVPLSGPAA